MADEATGGWVKLARSRRGAPLGYFQTRPSSFLVWVIPAQFFGMGLAVLGYSRWVGPLDDFTFLAVAFVGGMLGALALLALYGMAARDRG